MRHKLRIKVESNSKEKKGFTLVELLAVIVIIGVIGGISITVFMSTINKSKEEATIIAINNVKSAAELYSRENSGEIKWINQYKEDGTETGKFVCMTVRQLINNGYFDDKFFEEDIYHDRINDNTFIEIKQGTNYDNTEVIIHEKDTTQNDCEMSAINTSLSDINIDDKKSYTDRLEFKVSSKEEIGDVNFSVSYDNEDGNKIDGNYDNNNWYFDKLKDNTGYKIQICMSPAEGNNNFSSTICNVFEQATEAFKAPDIDVTSEKKWDNSKNVTITYDDDGIYNEQGIHYFKSEVGATITSGKVLVCDSGSKDGEKKSCSTSVNSIEANKWYETTDDVVKFKVTTNIEEDDPKIVTARIQDQTGNYLDSEKSLTKIDTIPPTCISSGGINSWTNKDIVIAGACSDSGSGCTKESVTKKITTTTKGSISPGIVEDKAGNTTNCSGVNVLVDKTKPTCNVSGGSSTWINNSSNPKSRTITAKCSDSDSGCATSSFSKTYTGNTNTSTAGAVGINNGGTVKDNAGNVTNCAANQTVKIDTTLPSCGVSGGSSNWTRNDVTVYGTCSDSGGSGCRSNVSSKITWNYNGNVSPGTVYDNAGNARTCGNAVVRIDKSAPTCSVSGGSDSWTKKDVTVKGTCSDTGGSGCKSNSVSTTKNTTFNGNVSPGTVCDNANNCTACGSKKVKVDKTAPTVGTITKVTKKSDGRGCGSASNSNYYFYFQISDNDSKLSSGQFKWSTTNKVNAGNSTARSGTSHWECIGTSAKNKNQLDLKYKVCDKAGNCTKKNW